MSYNPQRGQQISTNTTSTALNAGQTYTGTAATGILHSLDKVVWSAAIGETGNLSESLNALNEEFTIQPGETLTLVARGIGSAGLSPLALDNINIREDH